MDRITWATGHPPHRTFNDWVEDPWAAPADKARRRRERHARWVVSISERDLQRISDLVDQVTDGHLPARLDDLDASIAVGVRPPNAGGGTTGEKFGTLRGVDLLAWPKARRPRR
jgi:hypothetical protein